MTLSAASRSKALDHAAEKALADPGRYLAKTYPSKGAAEVAVAMLGHPGYVAEMLFSILE